MSRTAPRVAAAPLPCDPCSLEAILRPTLYLLLLLASPALATQVEGTEIPCPIGGDTVVVHRKLSANSAGGWDSDGARYASGGQFRDVEVTLCPSGLALRGADMARGLSPAMREPIEALRIAIKAEIGQRQVAAVPAWERTAMGARTYRNLGRALDEINLWLTASWLVRDQGVGFFAGLDGPVMADIVMEQGEVELKKDLDADTRKKLTFNLAVVAHRNGDGPARDRYLAALRSQPLTDADKERIGKLAWAAAAEPRFQREALDAMERLLQDRSLSPTLRASFVYQRADLLRRLGQLKAATEGYAQVAADEGAAQDVRTLSAYFLDRLAGRSPWSESRFQELAGIGPVTPPGGETP